MRHLGNPGSLKEEIERKYSERIRDLEEDTKNIISQMRQDSEKRKEEAKRPLLEKAKRDARIAHDLALGEGMAEARKIHEQANEEKYDQIFSLILKDAQTLCKEKEYISYVSSFARRLEAKNVMIRCLPSAVHAFHASTDAKIVADKEIVGAYIEADGTLYDLTLVAIVEARRDALRKIMAERLGR